MLSGWRKSPQTLSNQIHQYLDKALELESAVKSIKLYGVCDDEIKEGDKGISENGYVFTCTKVTETTLFGYCNNGKSEDDGFEEYKKCCKKVILLPNMIGLVNCLSQDPLVFDEYENISVGQLQSILDNDGKCFVEMEDNAYDWIENPEVGKIVLKSIKLINGKAILSMEE